jgi:hypothetical protein
VRGTGRTGQVVDLIHLKEQGIHNVVVHKLKVLVADPVLYIALAKNARSSFL